MLQPTAPSALPRARCLVAAIATPLSRDFRPDHGRLLAQAQALIAAGCDGIALFGTTGEGAELAIEDRTAALDALLAAGLPPARLIVSAGAAAIPDAARLAAHATDAGVEGVLLMPPGIYREGITEDATFRYFDTLIARTARRDLRLYLYHFPGISGVPVTPQVVRRLDERHSGVIAGVKDSGGDPDFSAELARRFPHLSVFVGSETQLPDLLAAGIRGTICGLANVMPRYLRALLDAPTAFDRRAFLPALLRADTMISRRPFIPSMKAILADALGDPEWARVIPPLPALPLLERQRLVADFRAWDATLPPALRALPPEPAANVVGLRRA
jgi:4-hydroxy-tetrahydrodipicolinate synthase